MKTSVLLVDDHRIVRQGLRALLESRQDMEVVAEAEEGRTAVRLARELSPDVVVLDVSMPDLNGIEAARMITAEMPDIKVIALSMHSDRRFVVEMLKAGASGYLLKDCDVDELVRTVRIVKNNQAYISPEIAGPVIDGFIRAPSSNGIPVFSILTAREREVLQLMAEGLGMKAIASRLNLSVKTIESHRQHIAEKLDTRSIASLTKYAVREGLTSL